MKRKKVLLAINHAPSPIALEVLEKELNCDIEYTFRKTTDFDGINLAKRHFTYFIQAIQVLLRRNKYDYIIFWQQFIGIYYILLSLLFLRRTKPKHIVLTFIFIKRQGFVGSVHYWLYKRTVKSKLINQIVCHSSLERKYYSKIFKHSKKFNFIPIGNRESLLDTSDINFEDFYFAAGRSNRDYRTLIEAFRELDDKLVIACVPQNVEGIKPPENVTIRFDAYNDVYQNYLKHAKAIIIPIEDIHVSAGQLVLVETMRYGKAAIVTEGPSMCDYDGAHNVIFIKHHNKDDIIAAVKKLSSDDDLVHNMGKKAKEYFNQNYTLEQYVKRFCSVMDI